MSSVPIGNRRRRGETVEQFRARRRAAQDARDREAADRRREREEARAIEEAHEARERAEEKAATWRQAQVDVAEGMAEGRAEAGPNADTKHMLYPTPSQMYAPTDAYTEAARTAAGNMTIICVELIQRKLLTVKSEWRVSPTEDSILSRFLNDIRYVIDYVNARRNAYEIPYNYVEQHDLFKKLSYVELEGTDATKPNQRRHYRIVETYQVFGVRALTALARQIELILEWTYASVAPYASPVDLTSFHILSDPAQTVPYARYPKRPPENTDEWRILLHGTQPHYDDEVHASLSAFAELDPRRVYIRDRSDADQSYTQALLVMSKGILTALGFDPEDWLHGYRVARIYNYYQRIEEEKAKWHQDGEGRPVDSQCASCGAPEPALACGSCAGPRYCSRDCAERHWTVGGHQGRCE